MAVWRMLVHKADPHAAYEVAHLHVLLTGLDRGRGKSVNLVSYAIEIRDTKGISWKWGTPRILGSIPFRTTLKG